MGRTRKPKRITLDGGKVRQLRLQRDLTQAELAALCNFGSHTIISKIETESQRPELETAVVIADYFGIPIDELVKRTYPHAFVIGEEKGSYQARREILEQIVENLNLLTVDTLQCVADQVDFHISKARRELLSQNMPDP